MPMCNCVTCQIVTNLHLILTYMIISLSQALIQMIDWYVRFPTMLQGCESIIEMLRGLYAHSLGCLNEAIFHFTEATKV